MQNFYALFLVFLFSFYVLDRLVEATREPENTAGCSRYRAGGKRLVEKSGKKEWAIVTDERGDIDVIPIGEEHVLGDGCGCGPDVKVEGARLVVIHNAFDHREIVEEAIAIMNGRELD